MVQKCCNDHKIIKYKKSMFPKQIMITQKKSISKTSSTLL